MKSLILAIVATVLLSSCGIFKKKVKKDYAQKKSEIVDRSTVEVHQLESTELSKTDMVELKIRKSPTEKVEDTTIEQALVSAIQASTELTAVVSSATIDKALRDRESTENRDIKRVEEETIKSKDLDKDSNTSWAANIPWYGFLIAGAVVVAVFYIGIKYFKII